jgi:hypothetical protein
LSPRGFSVRVFLFSRIGGVFDLAIPKKRRLKNQGRGNTKLTKVNTSLTIMML